MATTARAEGSCTEFEFGPLVPYSIVCLRLPASFSDAMNEYVLVIAIAAIPVITYVFVRRLGISRTPEGKFWMTLSAGVALVLLIVTEPGPGGPTRASIWLIFLVACFGWYERKAARMTGTPKTYFWITLAVGSALVALVLASPVLRDGTIPAAFGMVALAFLMVWLRFRALRKKVL